MSDTQPQEKRPSRAGWELVVGQPLPVNSSTLAISAWRHETGVLVLSALENMELPDKSGVGPQWHVSMSRKGKRPRPQDVKLVRRAFDMREAEEDNHHPGVARHLMLPVDPKHRVNCECKETEEVRTEKDGYRWTNPKQGEGACRGCELQGLTGQSCPIHAGVDGGEQKP